MILDKVTQKLQGELLSCEFFTDIAQIFEKLLSKLVTNPVDE